MFSTTSLKLWKINWLYSICTGEALWRNLISAACICNLILSVSIQCSTPQVRIGMKIDDWIESSALWLCSLFTIMVESRPALLLFGLTSLEKLVNPLSLSSVTLSKDMSIAHKGQLDRTSIRHTPENSINFSSKEKSYKGNKNREKRRLKRDC